MAKQDKRSVNDAQAGGNLYSQEAVTQILNTFGKYPDIDEVLSRAGIARHRLAVLLDDDEIAQAVETRLDALLGQPVRIEPSDTPEAELLRNEISNWFSEIVTGAFNALLFGYAVQEIVYQQNTGYIGLALIQDKPIEWFEPKNDGRLIYRQDAMGQPIELDTRYKFAVTIRKPSYRQPYGKALLSTLYWLWFFKQNTFKFWAKFLERFGTPILLGKVENSDIDDMMNALLSAHSQSVIAIDAADDVQVLGNNAGANASFETFNQVIIKQIQKVVLGQTLTSGNEGGGSYALGVVHENVRKDKLKSDIRLIAPTVQTIINALCELNGWQSHKIVIGEQKSLNKEQAERDMILSQMGVQFSTDYIVNAYGFAQGDIVDTAQQAAPRFNLNSQNPLQFKAVQGQQQVDDLAEQSLTLLSDQQIKDIVLQSSDIDDMQNKLYALLQGADKSQFNHVLDRALFTADVLGYVASHEGN